jgi:hypothetical protein
MQSETMRCCVPGCFNRCVATCPTLANEGICEDHLNLASEGAIRTFNHVCVCLDALEQSFADEDVCARVWARGRYLQFCLLIERAQDRVDTAWRLLKDDILEQAPTRKCWRESRIRVAPHHAWVTKIRRGPQISTGPGLPVARHSGADHVGCRQTV